MITREQYLNRHNQRYQYDELSDFSAYIRNRVLPEIFTVPEKVLDLAGGDGSVSEWLMKIVGCDVTLVDISPEALLKAKQRGIEKIFAMNLEEKPLPFADGYFDSVFWGDNIEHLYNPMFVLKEVRRVLKSEGRVIISFPNMGYWYYRYLYLKTGMPQFGYCLTDKPWEYEHIRCFNKKIIERMLNEGGFALLKVYGVNDPKLKFQNYMARFFPSIFASILIVEARKND